ncbi:hypothetical protein COOONC_21573 [Cooperia oncophora]
MYPYFQAGKRHFCRLCTIYLLLGDAGLLLWNATECYGLHTGSVAIKKPIVPGADETNTLRFSAWCVVDSIGISTECKVAVPRSTAFCWYGRMGIADVQLG